MRRVLMISMALVLALAGWSMAYADDGFYVIAGKKATQSWSIKLPSAQRFVVLADFDNQAVLDKETGLVWEKSPSTNTNTWYDAYVSCLTKNVGGRMGWRLPAVEELTTLVDIGIPDPGPVLPAGHPFSIQSVGYWTATTMTNNVDGAYYVNFLNGVIGSNYKSATYYVWAVRGGYGYDGR